MSAWSLIYRICWSLLTVLVLIGMVCVFMPKCRSLANLRTTRAAIEQSNGKLVADIRDLRIRQERFTSEPAYVERTAREIGMVRPNETVYMFTNATAQAATGGHE
jgi:cell division protein FtsB